MTRAPISIGATGIECSRDGQSRAQRRIKRASAARTAMLSAPQRRLPSVPDGRSTEQPVVASASMTGRVAPPWHGSGRTAASNSRSQARSAGVVRSLVADFVSVVIDRDEMNPLATLRQCHRLGECRVSVAACDLRERDAMWTDRGRNRLRWTVGRVVEVRDESKPPGCVKRDGGRRQAQRGVWGCCSEVLDVDVGTHRCRVSRSERCPFHREKVRPVSGGVHPPGDRSISIA